MSRSGTSCAFRPVHGGGTRPGRRASRSSSSARPTSARTRGKTCRVSETGGRTERRSVDGSPGVYGSSACGGSVMLGASRGLGPSTPWRQTMKGRLFTVALLTATVGASGCGGGGKKVSSASLQPRLLPSSEVSPFGFALQQTQDWSDPVNLIGEGLPLPQRTRPSEAVKEFTDAHFEGSAGEVLAKGAGFNETAIRVGVAKFASA